MIRCGVIGYGFLGKALTRTLSERSIEGLRVVAVADSRGYVYSDEGIALAGLSDRLANTRGYLEDDPRSLIDKEMIDLLVELTPTNVRDGEPGLGYLRAALSQGIDVVTANKGPLALAFSELRGLAEGSGALLRYEATVGGGIPIFSLVRSCLRGDVVYSLRGILNGTTNYILSRMHFEGMALDLALREAQMLGIAEKDPSLDVGGIDTASKIVILANSIMHMSCSMRDVRVRGIENITAEAMMSAKESGMTIKLIGSIEDGALSVEPMLVRLNHPLCVHGTLNAVNLKTEILKELTLIGHGAGESTISALINDIYDVVSMRMRRG